MRIFQNRPKVDITADFYIILALALLLLPLKWCLAAAAAALFHELCHIGALRLCGGHAASTRITAGGAVIHSSALTPGRALLCSLAGPAGGFFLLLFVRWIPRTAFCAAMQSVCNLLPLSSLDGGHILRFCAEMLFPQKIAGKICLAAEHGCLLLIVCLGVYGSLFLRLGLLPILAAGLLCLKTFGRKGLANPADCRYNSAINSEEVTL